MTNLPRGVFGAGMDGLGDPKRASVKERHTTAVERLRVERGRRAALSPFVRALQAATDRALRSRQ